MPTIQDSDSIPAPKVQPDKEPKRSTASPIPYRPKPGTLQIAARRLKSPSPITGLSELQALEDLDDFDSASVSNSGPAEDPKPERPAEDSDPSGLTALPRIAVQRGKAEQSPPLSGNDSAYSSGGSFASPTITHPRSASSLSGYVRPQLGLFPSSAPSTPKNSLNGRLGALSPAPLSAHPSERPYSPLERSQSAFDHHNSSSRRLLKKSSLSSLKKFFGKKKQGTVDAIPE